MVYYLNLCNLPFFVSHGTKENTKQDLIIIIIPILLFPSISSTTSIYKNTVDVQDNKPQVPSFLLLRSLHSFFLFFPMFRRVVWSPVMGVYNIFAPRVELIEVLQSLWLANAVGLGCFARMSFVCAMMVILW